MNPDLDYEHCFICGDETGRAGAADDSIYIDAGGTSLGPLCEQCYDGIVDNIMTDRLAEIIDNLTQAAATAELAETMTGKEVAKLLLEVAEQLKGK